MVITSVTVFKYQWGGHNSFMFTMSWRHNSFDEFGLQSLTLHIFDPFKSNKLLINSSELFFTLRFYSAANTHNLQWMILKFVQTGRNIFLRIYRKFFLEKRAGCTVATMFKIGKILPSLGLSIHYTENNVCTTIFVKIPYLLYSNHITLHDRSYNVILGWAKSFNFNFRVNYFLWINWQNFLFIFWLFKCFLPVPRNTAPVCTHKQ